MENPAPSGPADRDTFWLVFGSCGSAVLATFPSLGSGFVGVSPPWRMIASG